MFSKLELKRQSIHIITGLLIILGLAAKVLNCMIIFCCFLLVACFSLYVKRGFRIPLFSRILEQLQRKYEKQGIPAQGLLFYLLGAFLACFLFSEAIAFASILILAFGDSVSRLVGPPGYLKKPLRNKRFLLGILIGGLAATFSAAFYVPISSAFFGSMIAMLIEAHNVKIAGFRLDDNLLIPVIAGLVMEFLTKIYG
jgi:dolichol kinase